MRERLLFYNKHWDVINSFFLGYAGIGKDITVPHSSKIYYTFFLRFLFVTINDSNEKYFSHGWWNIWLIKEQLKFANVLFIKPAKQMRIWVYTLRFSLVSTDQLWSWSTASILEEDYAAHKSICSHYEA